VAALADEHARLIGALHDKTPLISKCFENCRGCIDIVVA
jgi:hypothetical protein